MTTTKQDRISEISCELQDVLSLAHSLKSSIELKSMQSEDSSTFDVHLADIIVDRLSKAVLAVEDLG